MESSGGFVIDPETLLDVETVIPYTNDRDVRQKLQVFFEDAVRQDSLSDTLVAITGFPAEYFDVDEEECEDDDIEPPILGRKRHILYFKETNLLILTMPPQGPHEVASEEFEKELYRKLFTMGPAMNISPRGVAVVHFPTVIKQPDKSLGPVNAGYITFALETGVSQSQRDLDRVAKLWIESDAPTAHVTQVLTIKISTSIPRACFKLWKREGHGEQRPRASLDQEVEVTLEGDRPVATGVIRISFKLLFERRAQPGTGEQDFVFSKRELGYLASQVWKELDFLPRNA